MRRRSRFSAMALGLVLVSILVGASVSSAALRTVLLESFTNTG